VGTGSIGEVVPGPNRAVVVCMKVALEIDVHFEYRSVAVGEN